MPQAERSSFCQLLLLPLASHGAQLMATVFPAASESSWILFFPRHLTSNPPADASPRFLRSQNLMVSPIFGRQGRLSGEEAACQWVGEGPGRRAWLLIPVSLPGKPSGWRGLRAAAGAAKNRTRQPNTTAFPKPLTSSLAWMIAGASSLVTQFSLSLIPPPSSLATAECSIF